MKIAICLVKYFPYGGLQRDMLAITQACMQRGHEVIIYCSKWQGEKPDSLDIRLLPVNGNNNHTLNSFFSLAFVERLKQQTVDLILGFNKMPGLDFYYAADTCFKAKTYEERSFITRFLPRYRHYINFEEQVFSKTGNTNILALSEQSMDEYRNYYQTSDTRIHVLPPGISKTRRAPENFQKIRKAFRHEFQLDAKTKLILFVGSGFKTKGLDRLLRAIASLPETLTQQIRCMVIGQDNKHPYIRMAKELKIKEKIQFFSGRDDIPRFLLGADLLLHPAYRENTGTILLEAAISGLPVLTTSVCGYSHYIDEHNLGCVVEEPFSQQTLNTCLADMLSNLNHQPWAANGLEFGKQADIYDMPKKVVDILEQHMKHRG